MMHDCMIFCVLCFLIPPHVPKTCEASGPWSLANLASRPPSLPVVQKIAEGYLVLVADCRAAETNTAQCHVRPSVRLDVFPLTDVMRVWVEVIRVGMAMATMVLLSVISERRKHVFLFRFEVWRRARSIEDAALPFPHLILH